MAEKNKKDSKIATTPQKQLALTTSTMAVPPIELVNRYQVLNPTPKRQYESSSSLAYPPITQNYTPVNQIIGTSSQPIMPAKTIYIAKTYFI
jgi:hypothetical protein